LKSGAKNLVTEDGERLGCIIQIKICFFFFLVGGGSFGLLDFCALLRKKKLA
jgi:hypothetical protein